MNSNYNQNDIVSQSNMISQTDQNVPQNNTVNNLPSNNKKFIIIAVIVVVAVISILCVLMFSNKKETRNSNNNQNNSQNNENLESVSIFQANIYLLSKNEGGRYTPIFNGYRPVFNFGDQKVNGVISLEDIEMISPGESAFVKVELESPVVMKEGTEFTITEGGRKVGTGIVSKEKKENFNSNTNTNSNSNNNGALNFEKVTIGKVEPNTNLTYDENGAFLMYIEDIFTITDKGTTITGRVSRGTVKLGDEVQILGLNGEILTTTVIGIEMFRNQLETAKIGDNVGLALKDVERNKVSRGQAVVKPNSMVATTSFQADIHALSKEEGGRHTPFYESYEPQFYIGVTDITGKIELPTGVEMVNPGDDVSLNVQLASPVAMEVGTEFSIREGGRTIATGRITKLN